MYPEYFKIDGKWVLAEESRMDSSVVICDDGHVKRGYEHLDSRLRALGADIYLEH